MSDALRELSEWIKSTSFDFGGHNGHNGHSDEKAGLFRDHDDFSRGHSGHSADHVVTAVTATEDALVTAKALNSLAVTAVTTKNDKGANAAAPDEGPSTSWGAMPISLPTWRGRARRLIPLS